MWSREEIYRLALPFAAPRKRGKLFWDESRKNEELRNFPMIIDRKENEEGEHPWQIRGRVIWVLNRFIEEPKK